MVLVENFGDVSRVRIRVIFAPPMCASFESTLNFGDLLRLNFEGFDDESFGIALAFLERKIGRWFGESGRGETEERESNIG